MHRILAYLMVLAAFDRVTRAEDMHCVIDAQIPLLGYLEGTVDAYVLVGKGGKASGVTFKASTTAEQMENDRWEARLTNAVLLYVTDWTQYSSSCEGQTVHLRYIFSLEGPERPKSLIHVHFRPPNTFVIVNNPTPPIADPLVATKTP